MFDFIFDKKDKAIRNDEMIDERNFIMRFLNHIYLHTNL